MNNEKNETLTFTDNNNQDKVILGTLEGPCASFVDPTRNNRTYSESLWNKVFSNPIVKEMIDQGGIPGELDHPSDRTETDSSRIAILMKEAPKKKNGELWAKFSILNTPLGKIAYTLAKAGFNLGISSRGEGDVIDNYDGTSTVDEDTYDFKCFDLVLLPAVKNARLHLVNESLNKQFDYKKALNESINSSKEEDKKLMIETLNNLNINYSIEGNTSEVDSVKSQLVDNLQEALMTNAKLNKKITFLNQQLSVSNAKEEQLNESIKSYRASLKKLAEDNERNKNLISKLKVINEELRKQKPEDKRLDESIQQIQLLNQSAKKSNQLIESYKIQLQNKTDDIEKLTEALDNSKSQVENLQTINRQQNDKISVLNENIHNLKKDQNIKRTEYNNKIKKATSLVEKYKSNMNRAVDKYIQLYANMLGIQPIEIKNRLTEKYTFEDIDRICEDLRTYKLNINSLPFDISIQKNPSIKAKVVSNKNQITQNTINGIDDMVDDGLLELLRK